MALTTIITLKEFNLEQALAGATLAFSDTKTLSTGEVVSNGKLKEYVYNFKRVNDSTYSGKVGNEEYKFNGMGGCFDGAVAHQLYIVEASIMDTTGDKVPSRGDPDEKVVINSLKPREQFAMVALQGIMYHIQNPLNLTEAQIEQMCSKSFEIANCMMANAAEIRDKEESGSGGESDKKEEVTVKPEELTTNTEKILYNIYVQNNNNAIDEKSRFDKMTGATYSDKKLSSVKGLKLQTDADNPLVAKLHADSEIKKVAEVAKVTEVTELKKVAEITKVAEVTKITNKVTVGVDGTANVNLASTDITVPIAGDVEVTNTVGVSGTVTCDNMLTEPVYVSVRNSELDVNVTNMPSVPTEPVQVFGTVSVDNFPSSGGSTTPDNDQNG